MLGSVSSVSDAYFYLPVLMMLVQPPQGAAEPEGVPSQESESQNTLPFWLGVRQIGESTKKKKIIHRIKYITGIFHNVQTNDSCFILLDLVRCLQYRDLLHIPVYSPTNGHHKNLLSLL